MSTSFEFGFRTSHEFLRPAASGTTVPRRPIAVGCLAPWQAKKLRLHIETNLAQRLDIEALAAVLSISSGHLCHAFKRTFGTTVHSYVVLKRLERARYLMLNTSTELSCIALSCGMSDQSHLTRWFRRVCGETPAAFRRARFEPSTMREVCGSGQSLWQNPG
jgi:AraC family transcriptional regulator